VLISKILDLKLEMFLTVPTEQKARGQEYPDSFHLHRRAQFALWSEDTLRSYLKDLENAETDGSNLMTINMLELTISSPAGIKTL
jgi:hypothetical protein